jgi:small conductance mechanosensitive channel
MPEEIDQIQSLLQKLTEKLIAISPQLIAATIILVIGIFFGSSISKLILRLCAKRNIDITISRFFASSIKVLIVFLFLFIAIKKIGVDITPFIALLGAGALGLSLAIQGPVSNYGAGIAIILTRPFKVDDTLTIHGRTGIVSLISLGYTRLLTEDGEEVTIPNKKILGEILTNSFTNLVVEGVVGIDYSADPEKAIDCVSEALSKVENIDKEIAPQIGIQEFGDSSINIGYRYWVKTHNYYSIQYAANLEVFKALKRANITIPFPQRDVHLIAQKEG